MARIRNTASVLLLVAAAAATARATEITFDFEADLDGWASLRRSWHWSDRDGLSSSLPADWRDGFAVLDQASSDELLSPQILMPEGGSVSMTFYLRSKHVGSNTLTVSYFVEDESFPLLDLGDYSLPNTTDWVSVSADIPPTPAPLSLEVFCFNGYDTVPGEDLLGCALDQIVVHINCDQTVSPTEEPTTPGTEAPTEATTEPVTDTPTEPETEAPTEGPTEPETDTPTEPETEAPTEGPTEPETEAPTEGPTEPETEAPTEPETEAPTEGPTEPETEAPTEGPTEPETEAPTEGPTEPETEAQTEGPTEPETEAPTEGPTEPETEAPTEGPTEPETEAPTEPETEAPTEGPTEPETEAPTEGPTEPETEAPTEGPTEPETEAPTEGPTEPETEAPTEGPTEPETDAPTEPETEAPTEPETEAPTEEPDGPLVYAFNTGAAGWTLSHLNGATWTRREFDSNGRPVNDPPNGPWVLEIQPNEVLAGTVVAQSPLLEAVDTTMTMAVTFWMDGAEDFQAELKVRRKTDFSTFDVDPIMNLDPFGDQENHRWITYLATLDGLTPGQSFNVILEGSLGGHPNNSVAVDMVEIRGVREATLDHSSFFDFENGLRGWSSGNLEGGRWLLQAWSELDPSVGVPRPSDGENFLFVERFDIHSGVITVESPVLTLTPGAKQTLELKFWTRGSVVYPATLRIRKKTPDGRYDALPFLNLRNYGDIDNTHWISFSRQYLIPGDTDEASYQLVIEADLGSDLDNLIALDDLKITTELAAPAGRS